jgi:hypothetical protein
VKTDLDRPFPLDPAVAAVYRANGFVHLRGVLAPETLEAFGRDITAGVRDLNSVRARWWARRSRRRSIRSSTRRPGRGSGKATGEVP